MTFKGATYSSILDLETLIFVWEANLRALRIEFKNFQLMRDINALKETQIKINIYEQGLNELNNLEHDLLEKIDALNTETNDMQNKIFSYKFIKGMTNDEIIEKLHISKPSLFYYFDKIDKQLENTTYGRHIKQQLSE